VFSQPLQPEELDDAKMVESLDQEIKLLRVLTRRLFEKLPDDASSHEYLKYLEKISLMCSRIGRMYFIRHKVEGGKGQEYEYPSYFMDFVNSLDQ